MHKDVARQNDQNVQRVRFLFRSSARDACTEKTATNLSEFPEAQHERAERVRDPLAALHLPDALLTLASINIILDTINRDRLLLPERTQPILPSSGLEGQCENRGRPGLGDVDEACRLGGVRVVANGRIRFARGSRNLRYEVLCDSRRVEGSSLERVVSTP